MELKDRIREAMQGASLKPLQFAGKMGVTSGAVTHWLDGRTQSLKADTAAKMQTVTGYSSAWIVTGKGEKLVASTATAHITAPMPTIQARGGPTVLSPMANALGQLFDMLPQDVVMQTRAYNRATEAILRVLQGFEDQPTHTPAPSDPAQTPPARHLTDAHS